MPERGTFFAKLQVLSPGSEPNTWTCRCECEQIDDNIPAERLEDGTALECNSCMTAKLSPLLGYYLNVTPDNENRMLKDTLKWKDDALEVAHDFIQWWFPTKTVSNFNEAAPILTKLEIDLWNLWRKECKKNIVEGTTWRLQYPRGVTATTSKLNDNFVETYERFLRFLGLRNGDNAIDLLSAYSLEERPQIWSRFNHNHLRITRMLESLMLLGYDFWAEGFVDFAEHLNKHYECVNIGENTMSYWKKAVGEA